MNINLEFDEFENSLKNQTYADKLKEIRKNNNTIVGQTFLGLILETYNCQNCKKDFEILDSFYYLDIEYMEILKILSGDENSLIDVDMDDFLEYFF